MNTKEPLQYTVPFPYCYWVVPGILLAGSYPGSRNGMEKTRRVWNAFVDHGIRHMVNLMEEGENAAHPYFIPDYKSALLSIAESKGHKMTFRRMPIKDRWVPSRAYMSEILDHIDITMMNNKPVYIHCLAGRGRTGTVVGCYLARHGLSSGVKTLKYIQELRKKTKNHSESSPEDQAQRDMILSWVKGE